MFATDTHLLEEAAEVLQGRKALRWLIGGSGSGKTTLSRSIAATTGIPVCDMDEAFFGRYTIDPQRHPATTAWFSAENPLGWILSLPWAAFDALYRAANAETLDLLAADLRHQPDEPLLVDGGITHPSVLVRAIPAGRVICLESESARREPAWETDESWAEMKRSVLALPDGEAMWRRFLDYDHRMTATIGRESRELGIEVLSWDKTDREEDTRARLIVRLGLKPTRQGR